MKDLILRNELVNGDYVTRFLNYLDVSENTIREYKMGLKIFFEYMQNRNTQQISREDVLNFKEYLINKNKANNTINLYLSGLKSFFKWLEYEGIYKDITRNIKALPVERIHTREAFSIEQIKIILEHCDTLREKILIELAITCGLRCNEIRNIRISDFQIKQDKICLYVLGKARKGTKIDFVIVPNRTFESIKEYIKENEIEDYLFVSTSNNCKGKQISNTAMRDIFNKLLNKCNMKEDKYVFHSMRHTNANLSIQNGADIREVSQNLRHKNIQTTMIYLHDLEAINNKCSNTVSNLIFE